MSSALVRQALAFVDPEGTETKATRKNRVNTRKPQSLDKAFSHPYKRKSKEHKKTTVQPKEELVEENIKKFLALSSPFANKAVSEKIIQRAIKGKPLLEEKIEVKNTEEKSILFPEDNIPSKKSKRQKKERK